jgi:hypothetical protein
MKSSSLFILNALIAVMLFLLMSCEKQDMSVLPKETQSGKNTFGCIVNNQLFIGGGYYSYIGYSPLSAGYNRNDKTLKVFTISKIYTDKANGSMGLTIANPVEGSTQKLSHATYIVDVPGCYQYLILNEGEVYLTKFDTINKIVSGRFSFKGKCAGYADDFKVNGDSVQITQGRFDVLLDITNN